MKDTGEPREPTTEEIREDIRRTRRQLADTAEALAHKANVPARAKEKAEAVRESAKAKAVAAMDVTAEKADEAKQVVSERARETMDKLPEPVERVMQAVRERPMQFAVGAVASFLLLRWVVRGRLF